MKRFSIFYLTCFLSSLWCTAQTKSLYLPAYTETGETYQKKNTYTISNEKLFIQFNIPQEIVDLERVLQAVELKVNKTQITALGDHRSFICLLPKTLSKSVEEYVHLISQQKGVKFANYFLKANAADKGFVPLYELFAAPLEGTTKEMVAAAIHPFKGEVLATRETGIYKFSIGSAFDPADVSVSLYETGLFRFCEPDMLLFLKPSAIYTSDQWYINSNSAMADTKIDDAWFIPGASQGNGIVIAVIDDGVRISHPDLFNQTVGGYDLVGPSIPMTGAAGSDSEGIDDGHGTNIAGVLVGQQNGIGVTGVAYNAKVMPIRVAYSDLVVYPNPPILRKEWITTHQQLADAINIARLNSADIINCSWETDNGPTSSLIISAIDIAVLSGRGGKGIPVFFATGNDNNSTVSFPADRPNVIAVGATTQNDQRATFSNYGAGIDIVAPGVNITTTDITGTSIFDWDFDGNSTEDLGTNGQGTVTGDYFDLAYTNKFGGTSAACPVAAGVMALILSNNPSLTEGEAREILETTCDKPSGYNFTPNVFSHPNGNWNNEVGYGRVNADKAVREALKLSPNAVGLSGTPSINTNEPQILNVTVNNNVCYSANNPAYIAWGGRTNHPFENNAGIEYIANGLIPKGVSLSTGLNFDIHGLGSFNGNNGYGFEVSSWTNTNYQGTNDANILFYVEPNYPYMLEAELQLGSKKVSANPNNIQMNINTYPVNAVINGINIDFYDGTEGMCSGDNFTLSADIGGSAPPYTYKFQRKVAGNWINLASPQTVQSAQTVQYTLSQLNYSPGGNNEYRIHVENSDGCTRKSAAKKIFVSSEISIANSSFNTCYNSIDVPLDLGITGGLTPYTYSWSSTANIDIANNTSIATFLSSTVLPGTFNYTVLVTDALGCSKSVYIEVNHHPMSGSNANIVANPNPVCLGGDAELTGLALLGPGSTSPYTYKWSDGSGNLLNSSSTNNPYILNNFDDGSADFTFTFIDGNNCSASSTITIENDISLGPIINEIFVPTTCPGTNVTIEPSITLSASNMTIGPISYNWSNGSTANQITVSDLVSSTYNLTITDNTGCYNTQSFNVDRLPGFGPPMAPYNCVNVGNNTLSLSWGGSNNQNYEIEVTWNDAGCCNDPSFDPATFIQTFWSSTNSLDISAGTNNNCFSWKVRTVCLGSSSFPSGWSPVNCSCVTSFGSQKPNSGLSGGFGIIDNGKEILAVPNPASTFVEFMIKSVSNEQETGRLTILDLNKRLVHSSNIDLSGKIKVDVQDLPGGMYIYSIKSESRTLNGKFVVKH